MYDPYDEKQWWSHCFRGHLLNPNTRWCCSECWIEQRHRKTCHTEDEPEQSTAFRDAYRVLGLLPPKTQTQIRKQYYQLSRIYHPDKNINCSHDELGRLEEKFKAISSAYNYLKIK